MLKKLILVLILFISPQFLISQDDSGTLVTFTEKDGIPSNTITAILQDHLGYIWIGTLNGLLKYDGYNFHRDELKEFMDSSAYNPGIACLFEDSELNLWIGVVGGVVKYNRVEGKYHLYNLHQESDLGTGVLKFISAINEDTHGTIWMGISNFNGSLNEGGLVYIEKDTKKIKTFRDEGDSVAIKSVYNIEIDDESNIWMSGEDGLSKVNNKLKKLENIKFDNSRISGFDSAILMDSNGILWGSQYRVGFGSYNPSDGSVKFYPFNTKNSNSISSKNVNSIFQDKDGTLWLGTDNGINHFTPKTEKFKRYFYDEGLDQNYTDNIGRIGHILKDKSGSLWLGSYEKFIHKFDPSKKLFRSYKYIPDKLESLSPGWIFGLTEDSESNVWIGGIRTNFASGLTKYNSQTKTVTRIQGKNNFNPEVATIYQDSKQIIWIGTFSRGLMTYDPTNNSFTKFSDNFQGTENILMINDILEDHLLNFWVGTTNGLFLLDRTNRKMSPIDIKEIGDSITGTINIQHIFENRKKELWIGTSVGLYKYNRDRKTFKRYRHDPNDSNSLSVDNVGHIYEDKDGILWLGTWLGGLDRFDSDAETFTHYTREDGLPSNSIQGILGDEENNALWLSTFEGISRFDLLTKEFRNFDASHGVQGKQFTRTSALETTKGEFIFGGADGINIFKPEDVLTNLLAPDILISDFKLFNKSVPISDDSPLQKPIYDTEKIILASDENDISIDFLATHYVDPLQNEYAYMLENYENEWRYVGNLHSAIYPNLPPGEYVFHVKAANNAGIWNHEGKTLAITILHPWWQTTWAYIGYGLLLILGIIIIDRFQKRRLLAKAKERMEIQNAEHRAKTAELQARVVQAENDRKSKELEEARQLQLSMLPKELPQLPNLDIAVYMQTATEVGGDYYDFHLEADGTIIAVIGDATGHGMKAGTIVTITKSLFHSLASGKDILSSFGEISRVIKGMKFQQLSMCLIMLKIKDDKLSISSAAMPPALIYRSKNRTVEELEFQGMPLGAMKNFPYQLKETKLQAGDTIFLFSDGLPELMNMKNKMYGYDRTKSEFHSVAEKEPEEIIEHLKNSASQWVNGNDPDDDVTFMVIKVK